MSTTRSRWAALGAAVAITIGAGGAGLVGATKSSGERASYEAVTACRLLDTRPDHVAHLKAHSIVEQAGPFLDDAGDMCGSLIILNVESMDQARAFAEADPYAAAGLFADVQLIPWNRVIG